MPLDSAAAAPTEPVKIDRSSGVGAALSGMVEKELPGALAESKAIDVEKKGFADEAVGRLEAGSAKRATLQAPLPPPPSQAPQPQFRSQGEAWGSLAMVMASIGSAFTRRPFLNSLNAAAEVMKAFRAGDLEAYKLNFDRWKAESEYGLKMYEYQRDAYKDAIASIDTDQKDALAKLRVLSAALKDDPLHRLTEVGNIAGIIALEQSRGTAQEKARGEIDKTRREGEISQELLESGKALRSQPNDPAAQQRYAAAQQAAKDFHLATHGGRTDATMHASQEFVVHDKDGKVVDSFLGRESPTEAGKIVRSDTGQPLKLGEGQSVHKAPPGSAGKQAATQVQGLIGATAELAPALENLMKMPVSARLGPFMGVQNMQPEGLTDALRRSFATNITDAEATAINQMFSGVSRQLATIQAQGARTGLVGLAKMDESLVPKTGWSGLSVARSYAEMRQTVLANIETMMVSPAVSKEQKELLAKLQDRIEKAVPFTVSDINDLEFNKKGKIARESVREFVDKVQARQHAGPPGTTSPAAGGAPPPGGSPAAGQVEIGNIDLHARPVVKNSDGSISTVRSMSFNEGGKEVLIPTVADDGSRILSSKEAIEQYHRTGKFLGKFDTPANATAYAQKLHTEQGKEYGGGLAHEKAAIKAGAPRDAVRKRYIEGGGDAATFDREVK